MERRHGPLFAFGARGPPRPQRLTGARRGREKHARASRFLTEHGSARSSDPRGGQDLSRLGDKACSILVEPAIADIGDRGVLPSADPSPPDASRAIGGAPIIADPTWRGPTLSADYRRLPPTGMQGVLTGAPTIADPVDSAVDRSADYRRLQPTEPPWLPSGAPITADYRRLDRRSSPIEAAIPWARN